MRRRIIIPLVLLMSVAWATAQAATVNISNNCNQNVTVSAYSIKEPSQGYLPARKVVYAHNSHTMTVSAPVKCIQTQYPQPGYSTVGNCFYFDGATNVTVKIVMDPQNSNSCSISVTE